MSLFKRKKQLIITPLKWLKKFYSKPRVCVGIDFGRDGKVAYTVVKAHKDGTMEILEMGELGNDKVERIEKLRKLFSKGKIIYETTDLLKFKKLIENDH